MSPGKKPKRQTKLTPLNTKKVIKVFMKLGYTQTADNSGSHVILRKKGKIYNLAIPVHGKELPVGVLRSLIRKAGLSVRQFLDLYS